MSVTADAEFYLWLQTALFWVGVLLVLLGLALILAPSRVLAATGKLNRWISTKPFFESINRPRYHERYFYRHHCLFGLIIAAASLVCLYMLGLYMEPQELVVRLVRLAQSEFGKWLLASLYYVLLVSLCLTFLIGVIVLIRPSLLKSLETWGNRWVDTDKSLEQLDEVHEIPENILPGRPRWFGLFVLLGAGYMIYRTAAAVF
jgi:hypothetical protein